MSSEKHTSKRYIYAAMAFLVPVFLLAVMPLWQNIYPFGEVTILRSDLKTQYMDFFMYYKDVLTGKAGLDYSMTKSLGGGIIGLWGYYLASPLNLLILLFEKSQIQLFVYIVTSVKIGLCGLTFYCFIRYKFKNLEMLPAVALGAAYAFTQYGVGQMNNLMWLDGMYMLPVVLLQIDKYIREGKRILFCIALACSIIFNWYTGYMNCIFAMLYYIATQISHSYNYDFCEITIKNTVKFWRVVKRIFNFAGWELLSVGLSCFILLPVVLAQSGSRNFSDNGLFDFKTNGNFLDIFRGFLIGTPNPNTQITLYCGVLFLLFFFYFFLDKEISKVDKLSLSFLLMIMVFSMFFRPLENIWCGFRPETSFEYRFLYITLIVVLLMVAQVLEHYEKIQKRKFFLCSLGFIGCFLVLDVIESFSAKRLWFQIGMVFVYLFLLWRFCKNKFRRSREVIAVCLSFFIFIELSVNARLVINNFLKASSSFKGEAIAMTTYIEDEETAIDQVKKYDSSYYRMEKNLGRDQNTTHDTFYACESMAYGYAGIQHYSSCYDSVTAELIRNLGYCDSVFPSFYHTPILAADSLLGVKYFLSDTPYDGYVKVPSLSEYNGQEVFENSYALPLAFAVSPDIMAVHTEKNPFLYINSVYSGLTGRECVLFTPITDAAHMVEDEDSVIMDVKKQPGKLLYLRVPVSTMNAEVYVDGKFVSNYRKGWMNHNVLVLGNMDQDHTIEIRNGAKAAEKIQLYSFDMAEFKGAVEKIKSLPAVKEMFMEGSRINMSVDGEIENLMLTIPYDDSWKVWVNGEVVQPKKAADAFMLIPLKADGAGHTIYMEYTVKGKTAGICISLVSVSVLTGWSLFRFLKKKKDLAVSKIQTQK